ncbi:MAG: M3 family oligoendopeptidase [Rickettsiales bacterium]|nr:M3 family oligoendopeptidase [Rickettsiales bacterium]
MSALPEWNLGDLYPSMDSPKIARDVKKATKLCDEFVKSYKAPFKSISAKRLCEAIKAYEAISDLLGRLASYADLIYSGDMSDPERVQFYQNIQEALNEQSSKLIYFTIAINHIADKDLKAKIKSSKDLAVYEPWLREVRAYKPYQLDAKLEAMLHEKQVVSNAWVRLFDESIARMRFTIGKQELSSAEALDLLSHKDGKKRQQAAQAIGAEFEKHKDHFALITNTLAKDKAIEDKWRGYAQPISARNVDNRVEDEVVDALVDTVKSNYKHLSHRYYKWKAKQFDKKKLDYWDRNAPLPKAKDSHIEWAQAQSIVLSAYTAFSPQLAKIGKTFFDKNWIDVPVRPGKAPGAFAHPTVPSAHPYLLLNYQGKVRDVMTLAHELGHGVHQVLAAKQGALMADTPLTLAETASVFGEMLTFQEMLRQEKSDKARTLMIAAKVEDMLNTVVRQIAFCEFERQVHDERKFGELTADRIGEIWMGVQADSLGPAITFHSEYQHYWMYIPHFIHSPFYVYAYAFGDCLVNSLYAVYEGEVAKGAKAQKAFEKKYIEMLAAGGTLRHKALLKPFGLDASKPDFWQQGLNMISGFIDRLD